MGDPAMPLEQFSEENDFIKSIKEDIKETHTEEIIIALCGPIGTDIHFASDKLYDIVKDKYNYTPIRIKLSDIIRKQAEIDTSNMSAFEKKQSLIDGGNKLRKKYGNYFLAEKVVEKITVERELKKQETTDNNYKSNRICYIIDSIKHEEEYELLKIIYNEIFYFVGVFSNIEIRKKNLEYEGVNPKNEIYDLMDRDSGEEIPSGQQVTKTFVNSDFFLRIDGTTAKTNSDKIERLIDLIFNTEIVTPTNNETAMYQAFAAAGNSACLSRQVGASITDIKGQVVSIGWNDVPKYGGGTYISETPSHENDFRCYNFQKGVCFNDKEKSLITDTILDELLNANIIGLSQKKEAKKILLGSRIKDLIEFSRAVHAEMHALIIGSQKVGEQIIGGKLFCTTYPCHNCARHIVLAGIKEVYYIEPYRKSLAIKLHDDAITENAEDEEASKVKILMYDGVAPKRYLDFFKVPVNSRKENGKRKIHDKKSEYPKKTVSLQAIPILEKKIVERLSQLGAVDN